MGLFPLTVVVLGPMVIFGIMLILIHYRRRCPRCDRHGLDRAGGYIWEGRREDGERVRGSVCYYVCALCDAHLKRTLRDWSDVDEAEWKRHAKCRAE